jgi:hypothetical protein
MMDVAAREARDAIGHGGGEYFRRFPVSQSPDVRRGDRVFYVEDGSIRGFGVVTRVGLHERGETCATTGRRWEAGRYVFIDAKSWQWIRPIPMKGFQGYRYARDLEFEVVGGWLDPKPKVMDDEIASPAVRARNDTETTLFDR